MNKNDKLIAYVTLISGLTISVVAEYYSVMGLIAIYPAMIMPIIIMGVALGAGKLSATVWVKQSWKWAPKFLKAYILPAIALLMFITSIGVFGFLSKAHSDQSLVSGDVQAKINIYDEKIKTAKESIEADRKQLKQMDEAVDQVMARSSDEKGADKANAIRRSQQRDRGTLAKDIEANQKLIASLNDEAAPIRAEVRKVEAEVGPIKYIAAFIYGDNPDANLLERAVTWITLIIVLVLDPLALVLLLASQYSFEKIRDDEDETAVADFFKHGKEVARALDREDPLPDTGFFAQELDEVVPEIVTQEEPEVVAISTERMNELLLDAIQELKDQNDSTLDASDDRPGDYLKDTDTKIVHTSQGMTITDAAGTTEIPAHTYVQNEEQNESGVWSKIANKTITEEEYLRSVKNKQKDS